jgi:histidinol-phosphate aminotransferase
VSLFRPEVEALEAYTMRERPLPVKVNQNESPWDWPEALKEEAGRVALETSFHRYPPFDEERLTGALEARWRLPSGSVLVGNGSNEVLQALFLSALGSGRTVLLPRPSFGLYRQMAMLASARAVEVDLAGGLSYDADAFLEAVRRERPELVLLCCPNNPTGAVFPRERLAELIEAAPGLVAVDEAYAEFSDWTSTDLLPEQRRLVVLRTFSKAWGGASLRLGYALAAPPTALQIRKALLPYNVSALSAALGTLALENAGLFEERVRLLRRERGSLFDALSGVEGLEPLPSEANFLLVRFKRRGAREVYEALKAHGVLVRDVSGMPGLQGCLRLSVGSPEENARVVEALREVLR